MNSSDLYYLLINFWMGILLLLDPEGAILLIYALIFLNGICFVATYYSTENENKKSKKKIIKK